MKRLLIIAGFRPAEPAPPDPVEDALRMLFHHYMSDVPLGEGALTRLARAFGGDPQTRSGRERMAESFARYAAALQKGEKLPAAVPAGCRPRAWARRMLNGLHGRGWKTREEAELAEIVQCVRTGAPVPDRGE